MRSRRPTRAVYARLVNRDTPERYRDAVVDPKLGTALVAAIERVEVAGTRSAGDGTSGQPAGYTAEGRRAELLLHDGLYAYGKLSPVPPEMRTAELPTLCAERFAEMAPLQDWLVAL